jgi:DNA polymerase-3 subunit alpha
MAARKKAQFIHLRVHSSYSLSEGAITPSDMVKLCIKHDMPAVAITDSGNLFGSLEFSKEASGKGVQPIIGCIMQVDAFAGKSRAKQIKKSLDKLLLIAKDAKGYQNLLKLLSIAFFETDGDFAPHITIAKLKEFSAGIILLTGGVEGPIGRMMLAGQEKDAEQCLAHLQEDFAGRLYIEIARHGMEDEAKTEPFFIDLAKKFNIPLVATNDAYFATKDMYEAHDALLCIADGRYTLETDRRRVTAEHYFKSQDEMVKLFADLPEAIENTVNIARRCYIMSDSRPPMLPNFPCEGGRDADSELRAVAKAGLEMRLQEEVYPARVQSAENTTQGQPQTINRHTLTPTLSQLEMEQISGPYFERLEFELDVIINMKFPGYFLIVSDFMRWSRRNNIPVGPGRGSGAGSLVAWALEITDLDPLRFGLLFERFLNPERVSMPDFDIDFCQERREEVIRYVQEKYGRDKVAQIITF